MKKIIFTFFSIFFVAIGVSIVVSIYMNTVFGGDINVMTFTMVLPMCTAIGAIVGSIIATIIPIGPIALKIAHLLGAKPGSLAEVLLMYMSVITVMLFVMCFAITAITHFVFGAPFPGDFNMAGDLDAFLNAWFKPITVLWGPCMVIGLMIHPLSSFLARKIAGVPPMPPASPGA
ncbi:MAG: hypothetical protein FWD72_01415 [Eggerthellaceae bacterium]|nr:hypothetical protein [Eggerthellaceae bacterium]